MHLCERQKQFVEECLTGSAWVAVMWRAGKALSPLFGVCWIEESGSVDLPRFLVTCSLLRALSQESLQLAWSLAHFFPGFLMTIHSTQAGR